MTDWAPIAKRNPIDGDPYALGELAHHFAERAETIRDVINGLRQLDTGEDRMQAAALDALIEQRDDVIPRLALLETRYDTAAGALRRYCPVLEQAQEMADDAQRRSWAAQRDIDRLEQEIEHRAAAPVPGTAPEAPLPGPDPEAALAAARAVIDDARRLLEDAVDLRDRGEAGAAQAIDDATDDDLRNPRRGFFGTIGEGLAAAADWAADHFPSLAEISSTLGMVSGALALVGFVFPPVATVAAAVGAVKLAVDVALMARGDGNWLDIATGVVGLATFGLGRIATSASRVAAGRTALRNTAVLRSTFGQAGALAGQSTLSEKGVRLYGAAMRSNSLRRFGEIVRAFGDEGATAAVPRIAQALTRFQPLEPPTRHMLALCPSAVRWANVARVAGVVGSVSDAWDVGEAAAGVASAAGVDLPGSDRDREDERR